MTPIFSSSRLDWSNAIGLFLINFGTLDLHILDYVESIVPPEELDRVKGLHLRDRIKRIEIYVQNGKVSAVKCSEFEKFFTRLEPIRELRNHIAHGAMRVGLAADQKTWELTLTLPKDLNGKNAPDARHLSFAELTKSLTELTNLIDEFQKVADLPLDLYTVTISP